VECGLWDRPFFFLLLLASFRRAGQVKIASKELVLALETLQMPLNSARKQDFPSGPQFFVLFSYLLFESADSVIYCALTT
jgi:hypothetical protein